MNILLNFIYNDKVIICLKKIKIYFCFCWFLFWKKGYFILEDNLGMKETGKLELLKINVVMKNY